jgi:hypothetical protein
MLADRVLVHIDLPRTILQRNSARGGQVRLGGNQKAVEVKFDALAFPLGVPEVALVSV